MYPTVQSGQTISDAPRVAVGSGMAWRMPAAGRDTRRANRGLAALAMNEFPQRPPAAVEAAYDAARGELNRYPDPHTTQPLVDRLARIHDVDPDQVVVGAGSVSLLKDLLLALCVPRPTGESEVVFTDPAFDLYHSLPSVVGAHTRPVPLLAGRQDLEEMTAWISPRRTAAILLSNPHSPTGEVLTGEELDRFLDQVPREVPVVLDEAYRSFVAHADVPSGVRLNEGHPGRDATPPNVITLRSFSKDFGLARARIGYLVATSRMAARIRRCVLPFSVNPAAVAAATAALDVEAADEYDTARSALITERTRMRASLLDLGYTVPESQGPFLWLPLGIEADRFREHCAGHGVLVKPYTATGGVRVSVGLAHDNDTFLRAATTFAATSSMTGAPMVEARS